MKIAIDAARFSSAEANELRKAMATFRSKGTIETLQEKMVGRMVERGYDPDFAQRCFDQIKGFGEYGFPESHAASFALLVYISSWIKLHYPDVFCAALLNSQPMGFYAPAQIVRDAREHGVAVRPPDVNFSDWDNLLEPISPGKFAVRLGLRQVDGIGREVAERIVTARDEPYVDIKGLKEAAKLDRFALRKLAAADAFGSMNLNRRQALWDARALRDAPDLPLFTHTDTRDEGAEAPVPLPQMPKCEQVVADYQTLRLSLRHHPMKFFRASMTQQGFTTAAGLFGTGNGTRVRMAGLVLIRQRPGSAKGVCFITIEDETGVANLVVWQKVMTAYRKVVMGSRLIEVTGTVQREGEIIHVIAHKLTDRSDALERLANASTPQTLLGMAPNPGHPRNVRVIPKSRDFH